MSLKAESAVAHVFADYRLEPARRSITRNDGTVLKVSGKPFDVLLYLVQHAGEVVDRGALLKAAWGSRVVEDNNVNQVIVGLRRLLGAEHIVTVAGRGYQFVTPVRVVAPALTVDTQIAEPESPSSEPTARRVFGWTGMTRGVYYAAAAALALVVGFIAIKGFRGGPLHAAQRIAVLPCDNLSPDPNDSYFAPGIHDELLNRLGQIQSLRVISRTSVLRYARDRPPIPQIGAELGVDFVMECGIRYNAGQVVVTAQLIDAATDGHVWSQSYPADLSNLRSLFKIQADIAADIAATLRVRLADDERERMEQPPTDSKEAYELYLAALSNLTAPQPDRGRAIELLDLALKADPKFVDAWIRKSGAHGFIAGIETGEEAAAHAGAARAAIERALALRPDSADAHAVLAGRFGQAGKWIESELEWRRAFELAPEIRVGSDVLLQLAVGNVESAVAKLEANLVKDPLNQSAASLLLVGYEMLGDKDSRRRHWERGEALFGSWMGDAMEPGLRLAEGDRDFVLGVTDHRHDDLGRIWRAGVANLDSPEAGLAAMESFYAEAPMLNAMSLRSLTTWALYFGDTNLALSWFRESVELEATGMMSAWLPSFEKLRREPGFKDLVRDQGLPAYWNLFGWPEEFCRPAEANDFECR